MPCFAVRRRTRPSLGAAATDFTIEKPPAPAALSPQLFWEALAVRPLLRVGDYEVGETFCPRLCGHPGIRY